MAVSRRTIFAGATAALVSGKSIAQVNQRRSTRVAHLTDLHIKPGLEIERSLSNCLEACRAHSPDFILFGGDLIMDALDADFSQAKSQWSTLTRILQAELDLPFDACLGNHDVWGWGNVSHFEHHPSFGKRLALEFLQRDRGYNSFKRGHWHFIILDSIHRTDRNGYVARLDDEQYEWLKQELSNIQASTPVLVLSHIPILSACAYFDGNNESTGNWTIPGAWMHIDARRLKGLFHQYPNVKLCVSGHIHLLDRVDYLGVSYLCNGAVSGGWWQGPYQECENGYSIIDLFEDGAFSATYHLFSLATKNP
ncbi:metallophosphoesterase family protein [Methylobacterium oxalidis]|uniref:metallophosphoesterase family protein n=1 Tax=Methylobacterium oxalidis TaxID=944322 RepID=UPI003314550C